jgi:mannan endo-1,4-beta-mannosidase
MHEMNGNWYPWCGTVNGNAPGNHVEAWRYMRSLFREVGNNKTIWVWSPYVHCVPDAPGNGISDYFPGTGEVDWLGLDGYNWGKTRDWSSWQGFPEIFDKTYHLVTQLAPGKPVMIAEVGCAEQGGDKGRWIKDAAEALRTRFAQIKTVVWFSVDKECDWRIESSAESLNAFAQHWTFLRE